jgi:hypothetical protein
MGEEGKASSPVVFWHKRGDPGRVMLPVWDRNGSPCAVRERNARRIRSGDRMVAFKGAR